MSEEESVTKHDARPKDSSTPPTTPDGRYIVVRGRLWRAANPNLSPDERQVLVGELMAARRSVATAKREGDGAAEDAAHAAVDTAKVALGERGAPWWADDVPDLNRKMAKSTCYAAWYEGVLSDQRRLSDPVVRAR
jgi:hypothetical protein